MKNSGLYLLAIEVTSRCNLRCAHCYGHFARDGQDLPVAWAENIASQAAELGVRVVTISGGEPLLLGACLTNYITPFNLKGMRVYLTTNAIGIGHSIRREVFNGLTGVQVSIDGCEQTHDRIRGNGTFGEAVAGIKTLTKWGVQTSVMMSLHSENINDVETVLSICHQLGVRLSIERCSLPLNSSASPAPASPESLLSQYRFAIRQGLHSYDPCFMAFRCIVDNITPSTDRPIQGGCTAGIAALAVTADLDILACVRLRDIPLSNLRCESLLTVWKNHQLLAQLRDRSLLKGACGNCVFRSVCGGCRANAFLTNSDILGFDSGCPLLGCIPLPI